ncbi:hypothetical protein MRQ36_05510 [Micromonospora sp. R77]|uniref:type IV toxin-antitoxin system AbiEi family antitoxin domain-containing protein n=1 Tax=Micromonospora sp. R77 TaxID=2925836 RepID=UPI001F616F4F|nr:type IV toxin-antitoxin system AbiEi family antitoxin domain-containing protein [Micromonospora sp. R77]MCI4062048.1 hypothetical protein [Micromonospora sp. R77]
MTEELWAYRDLVSAGCSRAAVRHGVDSGRLRRVSRGVYVDVKSSGWFVELKAILLRLPPEAVVGFHTAARLHGFGDVPQDAVHVIVPTGTIVPRISGVIAHESVLPVREPVLLSGLPTAPAARCAVDLARGLRRTDALPIIDLALRSGACRPDDLRSELRKHARLRGIRQARQLVRLADPRPECRQESQLRLLIIDAGLPAPEPQIWVPDAFGVPIYRLDLGYRGRRIGIEYDGASHLTRDRLRADRSRMNWLSSQGWTMRHYTDRDLYTRPTHIATDLRALLTRR